ncbi:hypothetical protein [Paraburkholderia sp. EG304]|uniref:hypothetical protein n=1 Tax=Paraburkholderia sp. EG304 TaxID=3237015 RepID=UPI0039791264
MARKEAKDLQAGDVYLHAGMVRQEVVSVTPVGHLGTVIEVFSRQQGKPDRNVTVLKVPAGTLFEVVKE